MGKFFVFKFKNILYNIIENIGCPSWRGVV